MNPPRFLARIWALAPLVLVLLSAVVTVCAYLQARNYPFFSDDFIYIVHNHKLAEQPLNQLWRFFVEPYNDFTEFLPLRDISYWFDLTLFGPSPAAFRVTNILLYLLCLPLTYGVTLGVWRYFRPADTASAPWAAAAVTALFTVHPSHVEAVVWIAGRKDVLAAMFSLLALWLAMRAGQGKEFSPTYAAAALLALVAAMLSKATAAAVAPVVALLWLIYWRDTPKHDRRSLLLLWPLASVLLAMCFALIFSAFMKSRIPFHFGIEAATRSLAALGWLTRLAISPEERHYLYPVFEDPNLPFMVALGVAVLAAAAIGGVVIAHKRSLAGFASVVFLLLCAPSMQLIPYAPPSLVSDRFLAIAVWPAILLIVAASWRLKPLPCAALLLVIAFTWTAQTARHPLDWRSPEFLIDKELRAYPGFSLPAAYKIVGVQLPQGLYGAATETAGSVANPQIKDVMAKLIRTHQAVHVESASTGSPQNAMVLLWDLFQALKQKPAQYAWDPSVYQVWQIISEFFEAQWKDLGQHFPDDALVHYNAGLWLVNVRKYEEAIVRLRAATESQGLPESLRGAAFEKLGLAFLGTGRLAEAESSLHAALRQPQSDMRIHCLFAMVYKRTGRLEEAVRAETKCLKAPDK